MRKEARLGDRLLSLIGVRLVIWLLAAHAFLPGVLNDPVEKIAYHHDEHAEILGEESTRRSYVDYHQLPQWEPYWCGGVIGLGNAGSVAMAPDFALRIIYGTLAGRRLALLLFVILGMEGLFRYARHNRASAFGAAAGAVAFSCSGSFPPMVSLGWGFMFHYNLLPWALLGFELGLRRKRWIVVGGGAMAWILLGAGTYALPYTIFVLGILVLLETIHSLYDRSDTRLKWWRPLATFIGIGLVGGFLCGIRLLPLLNLIATHTRLVMQKDQTGPLSALAMLILPRDKASWGTGAGEYYIGTAIFGLALVALLFRDRRAAKFWGIALLIGVIACGEFTESAPYLLMRKLPIYAQLRFPVRWLTVAGFFFVMAGTLGLSRLEDGFRNLFEPLWIRVRLWRPSLSLPERIPIVGRALINIVAAVFAAYVALYAGHDVVDHTTIPEGAIYSMDGPRLVEEPFRQARGNRWDAQVWVFASRGSLHCFDENELFESPYLRSDLPQEEYPAPGNPGMTVERVSWSNNEIVVKVHAPLDGRFLVNMNHAPAWKTDVGTIGSDGGLISVNVPAGDHVVTLRYRDWRVLLGALISIATILGIGYFGFKLARRRVRVIRRWWRLLEQRKVDFPSPAQAVAWLAGERGAVRGSRNLFLLLLAGHIMILGYGISQLRGMTASLRFAKPVPVVAAGQGDTKLGLSLEQRKKIFADIAATEPASRAAGKASFGSPDLAWSADDHRGSFERREVANVAGRYGISLTQAYLVLDEGIHEKWPAPDGHPLDATTTPLHPRRNYGW